MENEVLVTSPINTFDTIKDLDYITNPFSDESVRARLVLQIMGILGIGAMFMNMIQEHIFISVIAIGVGVTFLLAICYSIYMTFFGLNYENTHKEIVLFLNVMQKQKYIMWSLYNNLVASIRADEDIFGTNANEIISIKELIKELTKSIQDYKISHKILEKQRKHLFIFRKPLIYISLMNILLKEEKQQLLDLVQKIPPLLQSWTTLHQKELLEVEQELERQTQATENLSGQGAIDLQRVRLHEHIENLNQLKNTL